MKTVMQQIEDIEDRLTILERKVTRIMLGLEPDVERESTSPETPRDTVHSAKHTPDLRKTPQLRPFTNVPDATLE